MVLVQVGLEWGGTGAVGVLVAEGSTSVVQEVIVVGSDLALALLHAPENEGNAAQQKGTTDTAYNTTDNLLVGVAQAAAVISAALLCIWRIGVGSLTSGNRNIAGLGDGNLDLGTVALDGGCPGDDLARCGYEWAGLYDGGGAGGGIVGSA